MAATMIGPLSKKIRQDKDGHRNYTIVFLVESEYDDGPYTVLNASGLPQPGSSSWNFGNDSDPWAFCKWEWTVDPILEGEPNMYWKVTIPFSTRSESEEGGQNPDGQQPGEDPLSEPPKVSGSFVKYTREAVVDRFGVPILSSSFELLRGPQNEWDANRHTVKIQQNVLNLQLGTVCALADNVNDGGMWGLEARMVKLSNFSWERKYHNNSLIYYTRTLDFDIDFNTFDRDLLDEGTKVLRGKWDVNPASVTYGLYVADGDANPLDPRDFMKFQDRHGNATKTLLNGGGMPLGFDGVDDPVYRTVQKYPESNLFVLSLPAIL